MCKCFLAAGRKFSLAYEGYEVQRNENVRLDYSCPFSTRPILNECHNSSGLIGIGILFWIWELKQRIHAFLQERNWRICVPKTTVFDSYRVRLQIYLLTEQPNGLSVRFRSVGLHTPFNVGIKNGHGSSPARCRQCNGSFRIHLKNGDVYKVA